jgi:hypothetical protein
VEFASAKTLNDAKKTLASNNKDKTGSGKNDVYVFVTTATAAQFTAHGGSVGLNATDEDGDPGPLYGKASRKDLDGGSNSADEAVLVFADAVLAGTDTSEGGHGTAAFNEKLAFRLAYVAVHEAAHTFGLKHKENDGVEGQLAGGDQIRFRSDSRDTHNIFTRFPLEHETGITLVNNYDRLANDADIGLRKSRNGKPYFAYET